MQLEEPHRETEEHEHGRGQSDLPRPHGQENHGDEHEQDPARVRRESRTDMTRNGVLDTRRQASA